ncbi:MAG: transcription factor [Acidobacteria bacterium]|nr:transcription factor [Acidobacteriota bacterium]
MSASTVVNETTEAAANSLAPLKSETPRHLEIDDAEFRRHFNRKAFHIRHHLADHPLFTLPRLVELYRSLPEGHVEYNAGNIPVSQDPNLTPHNGLSPEETIRRIEECQSWLVIKHVENQPGYRELLNECLDQIEPHSEAFAPQMCKREAFIFISSPGSVTPFHMDPEYSFLLQIRGHKTISMFDGADRSILSEEDLEQYLSGGHRNLTFKDEFQAKAWVNELTPGQGLHVPLTTPHWVQNGNAVSVSFSIAFQSKQSEQKKIVYTTNAYLRKKGLQPVAYGTSKWRDEAKYFSYRALRRAFYLFGKEL